MVERGHGKIVSIASLLSFQGGIRVASYAASKHGVAGITKALANEWGPHGVQVNAIAPGYMATDNTTALRDDPDRAAVDPRAHPGRPVGRRRGHRRRRRLPQLARLRLRQRPRPRRRRRLDGPLTELAHHQHRITRPTAPPQTHPSSDTSLTRQSLPPDLRHRRESRIDHEVHHLDPLQSLIGLSLAAVALAGCSEEAGGRRRRRRRRRRLRPRGRQARRPGPQRVQPLRGGVARRRRRVRRVGRPRAGAAHLRRRLDQAAGADQPAPRRRHRVPGHERPAQRRLRHPADRRGRRGGRAPTWSPSGTSRPTSTSPTTTSGSATSPTTAWSPASRSATRWPRRSVARAASSPCRASSTPVPRRTASPAWRSRWPPTRTSSCSTSRPPTSPAPRRSR